MAANIDADMAVDTSGIPFELFFRKHEAVMLLMNGETGRLIDANDAALGFYGYSLQQIREMKIGDINRLSPEELNAEQQRALKEERKFFIVPHRLASGEIRTVVVNTISISAADNKYLFSVVYDITECKKTEKSLRESEANYRTLVETTNEGIWVLDKEGRTTFVNSRMAEMLGYLPEEMLGRDLDLFMDPEEVEKHAEQMNLRQQGISSRYELRFSRKDGSSIYAIVSGTPLLDSQGAFRGAFAMITDITERKRAEQEHSLSSEILRNMAEGINMIRFADSIIVYTNPKFEEMFGYDPGEMIGKYVALINAPNDKSPEETKNEILNILVETGEWHGEIENIKKDGTPFRCYVNVSFFDHIDYGRVMISVHMDITERKKAEDELMESNRLLKEARERAESANRAKSQFLANMSHEIRTPMNGIIGITQLLSMTSLNEEQQDYLNLLKDSNKKLLSLINDILDLSKIESRKIELEAIDFDLKAETLGVLKLFSQFAKEKRLKLVTLIGPDVPLGLNGDAERLCQVLGNLIGNAIKFTPKGSVTVQIRKDCEDEGSATLRFMICDTGIGIAADKLGKIFDPFTQADGSTTRFYGGTGLGLSISRKLVELMGGSIGTESQEGKGSTFWFTLALKKQTGSDHQPDFTPLMERGARGDLNCDIQRQIPLNPPLIKGEVTRLLLAEDDPINQMVMKSILAKFGYLVDLASTGSEALKALENNDYALVLMDCMMPVLSGYEATAAIRDKTSKVRNHAIPVIALTARAFKEDRDTCRAAGMDDYLSKPVDIADLQAILEKWASFDSVQGIAFQETLSAAETIACGSTIEIFDMSEFLSRSMGDIGLSRDVATIFINRAPEYIELIRKAVAAQDAVALRQSAHKLNGSAANLSLLSLSEVADKIESMADTGDLENAGLLLPELELQFDRAINALNEMLINTKVKAEL